MLAASFASISSLQAFAHHPVQNGQAEYAAALDAFTAHRKGLDDLLEERDEVWYMTRSMTQSRLGLAYIVLTLTPFTLS